MALSTYIFSATPHNHLIPYLAALHGTCITHDQLIDAFLPPLNHEKLLAWWKSKIADDNIIIILLQNESEPGKRLKGTELVGVALLRIPEAETGASRATVDNILVNTRFRRQGGAKTLIAALESQAFSMERKLLVAEAETGSVGEQVFKKFGFREVGRIPKYAISPADHTKKDQTILCKELLSVA